MFMLYKVAVLSARFLIMGRLTLPTSSGRRAVPSSMQEYQSFSTRHSKKADKCNARLYAEKGEVSLNLKARLQS